MSTRTKTQFQSIEPPNISASFINSSHVFVCVLKVSGEANETQISEALKRYSERAFFVREALFHLFNLTPIMEKPRPEILKVKLYSTDKAFFLPLLCAYDLRLKRRLMKWTVHMNGV